MKVAIIGYGWVGKAMHKLFPNAIIHDPDLGFFATAEVNTSSIAFVCVPTPLKKKKLDTSIVEECISWCGADLIIIRSTLNPGTADYLEEKYKKDIVVMPEYIGESVAHPLLDETQRRFLIIGGKSENRRKAIELFQTVYNADISIRQVTNLEAEVIKLAENRAIAHRVMEIQELFDVCEKAGIDYYTIREGVYGDDQRMKLFWTFIFPDKRGFNSSKCLQKDVPAFCSWAESVGYNAEITKLLVKKSNNYAI